MTKTLFDLTLAVSQRLGETHESKATGGSTTVPP